MTPGPDPTLRVLIFGASLRAGSVNQQLAGLAARVAQQHGATVDIAAMRDFDVPSYDGDAEKAGGIPKGAAEFKRRLDDCDAFIVSSPEYNGSMPGVFKNLIDWTSRYRPQPFDGKQGLLMSASPSMGGGNRGLWALRMPFEHLGARIYPDMFSLAQAHKAFAGDDIADPALRARFDKNIQAFLSLAEAAKHYPCIKRAWVEFLGEPPDPAADRVESPAAGMRFYYFEMVGTAVFAITGVLAVTRRGLDVFGALVLGIVTALGGGTVRDLIIGAKPFWINDFNYVWAAAAGALAAFWIGSLFRDVYRGLLYLDALGAALFAVTAADKVLALNLGAPVAVTMGVLTGIGGGLIRDVLAGRPTLLMSRDIYATPILLGCVAFVVLRGASPPVPYASVIAFAIIFGVRALAIYRHLEMPSWLTHRDRSPN